MLLFMSETRNYFSNFKEYCNSILHQKRANFRSKNSFTTIQFDTSMKFTRGPVLIKVSHSQATSKQDTKLLIQTRPLTESVRLPLSVTRPTKL